MTTPELPRALGDRYRIERELGRGGMATVYLAEDLKHRRRVAVKVLDPDLAGMLGPERFVREIETAGRLHHPHILPLLDSGAEQGLLYYVMPYIEGESLRARLDSQTQLPQEEAVRLAGEVARALDYAHRNGIVHRDIKPENILLADGQAVVADFGIARAIRESGGERLTKTGMALGSPPYMSPEQVAGSADVDARSDLYTLGCVLYEMLAGQPPFTGPPETLAHQHLNLTPRPVRELRPSVSPELDAAIAKALSKTPADRFATGAEFAATLAGSTRSATPVPAAAPAPPPDVTPTAPAPAAARRPGLPRAAWAVAVVLLAVVAALVVWWRTAHRAAPPGDAARRRWVWVADFEGPADDPGLAQAARDLVGAALDESKVFATVPAEQVRIALHNAGRPDTARMGPELARELAFRSSIPVVLDGKIGKIGGRYSIVLQATQSEDGRVIESVSGNAAAERELIPALTRAARELRQSLGERSEVFRTTESWTDAPTPSFEAFRLYLRGRDLLNHGESWAALPLFRRAVAVDPQFATAWTALGVALGNLGQADSALAAHREALHHPDRLTAVRRLDVEGKVATLRGDQEAALSAYEAMLGANPSPVDRSVALNNKAVILSQRGQAEEALRFYREAAAIMPVEPMQIHLGNITDQFIALNRIPEARAALQALKGTNRAFLTMEMAFIERSWGRAESLAIAVRNTAEAAPAQRMVGATGISAIHALHGDVAGALRSLDEDEAAAVATKDPLVVGGRWFIRMWLAHLLDTRVPDVPALAEGTRWGVAAHALMAARAGDSTAARRAVAQWPASAPVRSRDALAEHVEGWLELRRGHWERAIAGMAPNARGGARASFNIPGLLRTTSRWLVADAFEKVGRPDSAAAYLELILDPPAYEIPHPITRLFLEPFVRCRLVRLYSGMGRIADAEREWETVSVNTTKPDDRVAAMLDETRATLQAARGMRAAERK